MKKKIEFQKRIQLISRGSHRRAVDGDDMRLTERIIINSGHGKYLYPHLYLYLFVAVSLLSAILVYGRIISFVIAISYANKKHKHSLVRNSLSAHPITRVPDERFGVRFSNLLN